MFGASRRPSSAVSARERIPRFNFLELTEKLARSLGFRRSKRVGTSGFVEKLEGELYTTRQGFSMITDRLSRRLEQDGAKFLYRARVVGLRREGDQVTGVDIEEGGKRRTLDCSAFVNTLPINEAARMVSPALGADVAAAADALRFRALVFVGLKIRRPRVLPAALMYFREHSFNRITDLSYFGFEIMPEGRSLIVAELTCDPDRDTVWSDEKLVRDSGSPISKARRSSLARRSRRPTFIARAMASRCIRWATKSAGDASPSSLRLTNTETAGRQGRFQYVNTHVAMKMGYEAADRLLKRLAHV